MPFRSVLEDMDWLRDQWLLGDSDGLTDGDIRRASAQLDLLLVQGLLGKAWRHYGFDKQPRICGPDVEALAREKGFRLNLAGSVIAGGGRVAGINAAFLGSFRADNPITGVRADAEQGFRVVFTVIAGRAGAAEVSGPLTPLVKRKWFLAEYCESIGAVRRGTPITRREVIQFFRNYEGGAHHRLVNAVRASKKEVQEVIKELDGQIDVFDRN